MKGRMDKLEAIHRINESILTILDIDKLMKRVLHIMEHTFGFDTAALLLYDEKSGEFYVRAATGYKDDIIRNFRTTVGGKGITGYVAKTREPLYVPNIDENSRYISGINSAKSEIAIPLIIEKDRLIGVLDIESKQEYSFTEDDFEGLCLFASHLSLALHNALLFENERKKTSQLLVINKIRQRISVNLEPEKLLQIVAQSVVEFFSYYQVLIFLDHEGEEYFRLMAQAGLEELLPKKERLDKEGFHIIGEAFNQHRTALVRDSSKNRYEVVLFENVRSELAIPIALRKTILGVIYIASRSQDAFDKKDIHMLEVISEELSLIIRDMDDLSKLIRKNKQMEIMRRIGKVAIQSFDLKAFFDDIVNLVYEMFGYHHVAIFIYEKLSQELELVSYVGEPMKTLEVGDKISVREGISGFVARSGKYYLCNDTTKEKKYLDKLINTKSELAIPIQFEDRVLGVINIESSKLNQFESADVEIFLRITDQVSYTLVNAELYKKQTSAHNLLLNLNTLGREVNATFDIKKILSVVIRKLPLYAECRLISVFFYDPGKKILNLAAHNLPDMQGQEPFSISADDNRLMSRVITLKHSIHVSDIEEELGILKGTRYETKSFLNILLCYQNRIIGILNLTDKLEGNPFTSEEFYLIHSFGEHLSNAIVNSEKYQEILELSITDGLTGLYVHRFFQNTLEKEIARAKRHQAPLSLILIDFDNFKQFNDSFGHQIGDIILREIAVLVRKEIREYDIACRYGGEEFGIVLPSTSLLQAKSLANRLREKVAAHTIEMGSTVMSITISQGVAEYSPETDKDAFIRQTDMALFRAKEEGRDRVCIAAE
ncbi:GAF domain-containing protein [Desulfococcaceae bacterium HSG8]|nr:GAF domain-containing protein [Desulfococcaceae bacterium HSG8]